MIFDIVTLISWCVEEDMKYVRRVANGIRLWTRSNDFETWLHLDGALLHSNSASSPPHRPINPT
jgi:hypothetical protein